MEKNSTAQDSQLSVVAPRRAPAAKFFRIRDLEKFQHYKNRNPPWVKLHGEQLEDYYFQQLPDAVKFHALALIYLASKTGNKIPNDPEWVSARIGARDPVDFRALTEVEFLEPWKPREQKNSGRAEQLDLPEAEGGEGNDSAPTTYPPDASKMLASCKQVASAETETEAETEAHTETASGHAAGAPDAAAAVVGVGSRFSYRECVDYAKHLKARGQLVGGRRIENPGGLARAFHREGTADDEIENYLRPPPAPARREFASEPCPSCLGTKTQSVEGKGARPCPDCVDEQGRRTGLKPKEGMRDGRADDG